jgi:hypothetical protein
MVNQQLVTVSGNIIYPDPVIANVNDQIVWENTGSAAVTLSSADGTTFTTGQIQPGQKSLPITMLAPNPALKYVSNPPGVNGTIVVNAT